MGRVIRGKNAFGIEMTIRSIADSNFDLNMNAITAMKTKMKDFFAHIDVLEFTRH